MAHAHDPDAPPGGPSPRHPCKILRRRGSSANRATSGLLPGSSAALEISPAEAAAIADRFEREDLRALGYRFEGDKWCRAARFAAYRDLLGDRFDGRVLADEDANPNPPPFFAQTVQTPHSVVTAHLVDIAGHPTLEARDQILAFLTSRLTEPAS